MSINEIILNYRSFLLDSSSSLSKTLFDLDWDKSPYFLDDWMQANWELLVESQIQKVETLNPYGFNESSTCRYLNKERISTHQIICQNIIQSEKIRYVFQSFTTKVQDSYENAPPFDYINVKNPVSREHLVLPLDKFHFSVVEIRNVQK